MVALVGLIAEPNRPETAAVTSDENGVRTHAGGVFCVSYPTSDMSARKPGLDTAVIEVGSGGSAQQQQCATAAVRGGNSARQCPAASRVTSQQPGTHPPNPSASPQPIGSRNPRGAFLRSCGTAAVLLALLLRGTTPHLWKSCFWCVSDGTPSRRRDHGEHGRATVGARACYAGLCAVPTDHQGHVWDCGKQHNLDEGEGMGMKNSRIQSQAIMWRTRPRCVRMISLRVSRYSYSKVT